MTTKKAPRKPPMPKSLPKTPPKKTSVQEDDWARLWTRIGKKPPQGGFNPRSGKIAWPPKPKVRRKK